MPLPRTLTGADGDAGDDDGFPVDKGPSGGRFAEPGQAMPPQVVNQVEQPEALERDVGDAGPEETQGKPGSLSPWPGRPDGRGPGRRRRTARNAGRGA